MFQMPGLVQPPLTGQPPQIFGYDGLTNLQQLPPDMTAQMFADSNLLLDDSQDAKRRRIARVSFPHMPVEAAHMLRLASNEIARDANLVFL